LNLAVSTHFLSGPIEPKRSEYPQNAIGYSLNDSNTLEKS